MSSRENKINCCSKTEVRSKEPSMDEGKAAKPNGGNIVTQVDNSESLNFLKVLGSGRK